MGSEAFEPGQFVLEFWSRLWIPVGQVDGSDQESMNSGLNVAGLVVFGIARQACTGQHRSVVSSENGNAIPRTLPLPDCFVAKIAQGTDGKCPRFRLELLETDHIRLSFG